MSGIDLVNGTVAGMAELLKSGELSPVELTTATLERIDEVDGPLKGFTTVTGDYGLERAREAEEEIQRGEYRGPLHGIPYTLKDLIDTAGIRTTYGYLSHDDYVPETNARVHELMEKAGAILVGKVNCHFRRDVAVTCFNPWDVSRSPGHSSAGSGLAVAASMGLISIGSDTGGSVRIPAAWSGVVGLRATFGLISRHRLFGPSWSFDQAGPLAKTVEDTALALQALAVHDPEDPVSLRGPFPGYRAALEGGIEGVKVGVLEEFVGSGCTEEVERAVRRAVTALSDLGAEVEEVSIEGAAGVSDIHNTIVEPESAVYYREVFPPERMARIDDDMKLRLERGGGDSDGGLPGCTAPAGASEEGGGKGDEAGGRGGVADLLDDGFEGAGDAGDDRGEGRAGFGGVVEPGVYGDSVGRGAAGDFCAVRVWGGAAANRAAHHGQTPGGGVGAEGGARV